MTLKEKVTHYINNTLLELDEGKYYVLEESDGVWKDDEWFKWNLPEGLSAEGIASDNGGEWSYDVWSVVEFTDGKSSLMVKFEGYYQSHIGSEYQGWKFVKPKTQERIVYV